MINLCAEDCLGDTLAVDGMYKKRSQFMTAALIKNQFLKQLLLKHPKEMLIHVHIISPAECIGLTVRFEILLKKPREKPTFSQSQETLFGLDM